MAADGFINLLKPPGMTSHDAVAWLRRRAATSAGHAGTLDRSAAGVLVVCVGRARRLSQWAMEGDKAYVGEVTLGVTTTTLDAEGEIVSECDASAITAAQAADALARFEGEIEQTVPAYSAVHADGQRLYQFALEGRTPPHRTRRVRITSARMLDFAAGRHPRMRIEVECSKGTYIRALAADVGAALGCGGCLSFLVRTRVGVFEIAESTTIEETGGAIAGGRFADLLRPLDAPLAALPAATLDAREAELARHGSAVPAPAGVSDGTGLVRIYGPGQAFIGLAQLDRGELRPRVVVCGGGS